MLLMFDKNTMLFLTKIAMQRNLRLCVDVNTLSVVWNRSFEECNEKQVLCCIND